MDLVRLGTEAEDAGESVNRAYWEQKASKESLPIMDELVGLIKKVRPEISPNYNKHHIGLASGGAAQNFVTFYPNKSILWANFKLPNEQDLTAWIDDTGLSIGSYDTHNKYYRVRVRKGDPDQHRAHFIELIKKAHDLYFG